MVNYAMEPDADDLKGCTCIALGGCAEFDSPCPVCGQLGVYDPCPAMGFGCGGDGDAGPCECCTPGQFQNARRPAEPPVGT